MMWLLAFSITALFIKLILFFHHNVKKEAFLLLFISSFFILNIFDLLSLIDFGLHSTLLLKVYYGVLVFCVFYLLLLSSFVSQSLQWLNSRIALAVILGLIAIILFSDFILAGSTRLENGAVTRIPGEYYFTCQIYVLGTLLLTLGLLIRRIIQANEYYLKARCLITLLSFIPSILVIITVIILMQLGYKVNVVGILSLTNCFMLLTFIPLSSKQNLFNTMKFVPFTRERNNQVKMQRLMEQCYYPAMGVKINLEALLEEIETLASESTAIYQSNRRERRSGS